MARPGPQARREGGRTDTGLNLAPWDEEPVLVADDPPGEPETHPAGCLCGACFRWCLSDSAPWQAPYRLAAIADPSDADRMREHEELVERGMWLARQDTHHEPPGFGAVLDDLMERLANRCEVIDSL